MFGGNCTFRENVYIVCTCKPDFISLVRGGLIHRANGGEKSHRPLSRGQGF